MGINPYGNHDIQVNQLVFFRISDTQMANTSTRMIRVNGQAYILLSEFVSISDFIFVSAFNSTPSAE
jgi:hypothetical protein